MAQKLAIDTDNTIAVVALVAWSAVGIVVVVGIGWLIRFLLVQILAIGVSLESSNFRFFHNSVVLAGANDSFDGLSFVSGVSQIIDFIDGDLGFVLLGLGIS